MPRLAAMTAMRGTYDRLGDAAFQVRWENGHDTLVMIANFGEEQVAFHGDVAGSAVIHESRSGVFDRLMDGTVFARSVAVISKGVQ